MPNGVILLIRHKQLSVSKLVKQGTVFGLSSEILMQLKHEASLNGKGKYGRWQNVKSNCCNNSIINTVKVLGGWGCEK